MATLSKRLRRAAPAERISKRESVRLVEVAAQATLAGVTLTVREFLALPVEQQGCWIVGRERALSAEQGVTPA